VVAHAKSFRSIRTRLVAGTLALGLVPLIAAAVAISLFANQAADTALRERATEEMQAIRAVKTAQIRAYFDDVSNLLQVLAASPQVRTAMADMGREFFRVKDSLPVPVDAARKAVARYLEDEFGREYANRNQGARPDAEAIARQLSDEAVAAQYLYIVENPQPLGRKNAFDRAADASAYSELHAPMQAFVRELYEKYGFYDVFLVEPRGTVVYTYFKETDYGTSLLDGPWAESGLAEAFIAARDAGRETVVMADYRSYVPSYDDQAAFVAVPMLQDQALLGVLIVQLPIDKVNGVMSFDKRWKESGLGESGEGYLVGPDYLPRSISRFAVEDISAFAKRLEQAGVPGETVAAVRSRATNVGLVPVKTQGIEAALGGRAGTGVYPDYRGVPVLGSYAPLDIFGKRWAVLAEIDETEAVASVAALRSQILLVTAAALLLTGAFAVYVAIRLTRSINRPLLQVHATVKEVAKGNIEARTRLASHDEIGELADAFDALLDEKVSELARAAAENDQLNESVIKIMQSVSKLAMRDLTERVPVTTDVTGAVSDAINLMASETSKALKRVTAISSEVAQATTQVRERTGEAQRVAQNSGDQAGAASTELETAARAIREIAGLADNASRNAQQAITATKDAMEIVRSTVDGISSSREQIRETEKRVKRLGERAQEISSVVGIINQIAERTSVLALNASMQAVAAGDAGRGFAVVADEVKRLAENARQATQQIASLVGAIQADTSEATQAMNVTIGQIVDISKLAERAGSQMGSTRVATENLVRSVESISSSSDAQAKASETLLSRARQLVEASNRTLGELGRQQEETSALSESAKQLLDTVGMFRLPA
jgi:methyl-accepting chemotaxis protein